MYPEYFTTQHKTKSARLSLKSEFYENEISDTRVNGEIDLVIAGRNKEEFLKKLDALLSHYRI